MMLGLRHRLRWHGAKAWGAPMGSINLADTRSDSERRHEENADNGRQVRWKGGPRRPVSYKKRKHLKNVPRDAPKEDPGNIKGRANWAALHHKDQPSQFRDLLNNPQELKKRMLEIEMIRDFIKTKPDWSLLERQTSQSPEKFPDLENSLHRIEGMEELDDLDKVAEQIMREDMARERKTVSAGVTDAKVEAVRFALDEGDFDKACEELEHVDRLIVKHNPEKYVHAVNMIISYMCEQGNFHRVAQFMEERLFSRNIEPSDTTLCILMDAAMDLKEYDRARRLYDSMINRFSWEPTFQLLVRKFRLAFCQGKSYEALHLVDNLENGELGNVSAHMLDLTTEEGRNKVLQIRNCYQYAIRALAKDFRMADRAFEIFENFKITGIPPTVHTFSALLTACSQTGDIHRANEVWREFTLGYGIEPDRVASNCMLQVYARANWLKRRKKKTPLFVNPHPDRQPPPFTDDAGELVTALSHLPNDAYFDDPLKSFLNKEYMAGSYDPTIPLVRSEQDAKDYWEKYGNPEFQKEYEEEIAAHEETQKVIYGTMSNLGWDKDRIDEMVDTEMKAERRNAREALKAERERTPERVLAESSQGNEQELMNEFFGSKRNQEKPNQLAAAAVPGSPVSSGQVDINMLSKARIEALAKGSKETESTFSELDVGAKFKELLDDAPVFGDEPEKDTPLTMKPFGGPSIPQALERKQIEQNYLDKDAIEERFNKIMKDEGLFEEEFQKYQNEGSHNIVQAGNDEEEMTFSNAPADSQAAIESEFERIFADQDFKVDMPEINLTEEELARSEAFLKRGRLGTYHDPLPNEILQDEQNGEELETETNLSVENSSEDSIFGDSNIIDLDEISSEVREACYDDRDFDRLVQEKLEQTENDSDYSLGSLAAKMRSKFPLPGEQVDPSPDPNETESTPLGGENLKAPEERKYMSNDPERVTIRRIAGKSVRLLESTIDEDALENITPQDLTEGEEEEEVEEEEEDLTEYNYIWKITDEELAQKRRANLPVWIREEVLDGAELTPIEQAERFYTYMTEVKRIRPKVDTLNAMLKVYTEGLRVHRAVNFFNEQFKKHKLVPDNYSFHAMIKLTTRTRKLEDALSLLSQAENLYGFDNLLYDTPGLVVDCLAREHRVDEALTLLEKMHDCGHQVKEHHVRMLRSRMKERDDEFDHPIAWLVGEEGPHDWESMKNRRKMRKKYLNSKVRRKEHQLVSSKTRSVWKVRR